jgi:hypothetical protein
MRDDRYPQVAECVGGPLIIPTLRERLVKEKTYLTEKLEKVNTTLQLLDENPKMEAFHDAVVKAGF